MKKYIFFILLVVLSLQGYGQSIPLPWGGKNSTVEVLGGLKIDSGLQFPAIDLSKKYIGKGLDSSFRVVFSTSDSLPYFMKNGQWIKFVSKSDLDSVAAIRGDSAVNLYNSNGTIGSARTVLGGGFDLSITGVHHLTLSTTNALDLIGGTGAYMNLNTPLGVSMQGGKVNTAVKLIAYGARDTILVNDGTYDHEFTSGSGASFAYLPTGTSAPTGQEYIIGDAKGISGSGSTITIDAGPSNFISSSRGTSSQTYVINTNGEIAHLKKLGPTTWLVESGGNAGFDTGTVVGNGLTSRLLATNASGKVITPWAIQWDDINKYFEISHSFRYDSVHHTWAMGDYSAINNSTWWSLDDAAKTWAVNAINGATITALAGSVVIDALNLKNTGGIINSALTFYNYGTTNTISGGTGVYDIQYTGSTGGTNLNITNSSFPIGAQLIISDLDGISATSNIAIGVGGGNSIIGPAGTGSVYVISTNTATVKLKKVTSTKWKVE